MPQFPKCPIQKASTAVRAGRALAALAGVPPPGPAGYTDTAAYEAAYEAAQAGAAGGARPSDGGGGGGGGGGGAGAGGAEGGAGAGPGGGERGGGGGEKGVAAAEAEGWLEGLVLSGRMAGGPAPFACLAGSPQEADVTHHATRCACVCAPACPGHACMRACMGSGWGAPCGAVGGAGGRSRSRACVHAYVHACVRRACKCVGLLAPAAHTCVRHAHARAHAQLRPPLPAPARSCVAQLAAAQGDLARARRLYESLVGAAAAGRAGPSVPEHWAAAEYGCLLLVQGDHLVRVRVRGMRRFWSFGGGLKE